MFTAITRNASASALAVALALHAIPAGAAQTAPETQPSVFASLWQRLAMEHSPAKCFDKAALSYVACAASAFSGFSVAVGVGYAWGAADGSVDWVNRYASDTHERKRYSAHKPWGAYSPFRSHPTTMALLADPANQHAASLSRDVDLDGALGEIKVGYDRDFGDWVFGGAASIGVIGFSGDETLTLYPGDDQPHLDWRRENFVNGARTARLEVDSDWTAALLARVGYKVDPKTLVFATTGVTIQDFEATITDDRGQQVAKEETTELGFTIGAGVERQLREKIFVALDYRYTSFGAVTLSGSSSHIDDGGVFDHGTRQRGNLSESSYNAEIDPYMHALRASIGYRL